MEIKPNQVVKLKNGIYGVVASFNNIPFQLIFKAYTNPVAKYNEELKHTNHNYDIVEIYDGANVANVTEVFSTKFTPEGLDLLWKGNEE